MLKNNFFVHTIKTPYSHYAYDVNTDSVMKVSTQLYDYLQDLQHGITPVLLDDVNEEINELKKQGYFHNKYPSEIKDQRLTQLEYLINNRIEGMTLQITQACNMRCSYCNFTFGDNVHGRSHTSNNMSYETAVKAVDFYYSHSRDAKRINISFYGGEPLIEYEKIKKIIRYVNKKFEGKDISFNITTNAILLTPEKLEFLDSNNVSIMVSLDGPEEVQNKSRKLAGNGKGSYDTIIKQLGRLKEKCPKLYRKLSFNSVIDPLYEITPLVDFYKQDIFHDSLKGFDVSEEDGGYSINTPVMDTPAGTTAEGSDEFYLSERCAELLAYYYLIGITDKKYMNPIAFNVAASMISESRSLTPTDSLGECCSKGGPCIPGVHNTFVRVDGEFFPCEKGSDISHALNIGNIEKGYDLNNIKKILNIGKLTEAMCLNCWVIRHCSSCAIHANKAGELSKDMILGKCASVKGQFEESLKQLITLDELRSILLKSYKEVKM